MKKFYSIILTTLIAASLAGCSESPEISDNTDSSPTTPIAEPDTPATNNPLAISENDVETVKKSYGEDRPVIDTKLIDLDFDGEDELLVLTTQANPKVFELWEKTGGKMELASSFGAGKLNWIDKISLKQGEIDGEKAYLFSFSMSGENNMTADEVLSAVKKTSDGYEVEHLLSRGKITYPDIEEPSSKEFYRKGWNKSDIGLNKDYADISKEEYEKLYKEYTGADFSSTSV